MSAGTKVILAIVGLLVGVLIVYYGVMLPTPGSAAADGEIAAETAGEDAPVEPPIVIERESPAEPPIEELATRPRGLLSSGLENADAGRTPDDEPPAETLAVLPRDASAPPSPEVTNAAPPIEDPMAESATDPPAEPATVPQPNAAASIPVDYTIRDGDTLMTIAANWFGDPYKWDLIAKANPGLNPRRLRIGQRITLPPRDAQRSETPTAGRESLIHVVEAGDTLSGLAKAYYGNGGLWERIFMANRTALNGDPDSLQVGMKLIIPPSPY